MSQKQVGKTLFSGALLLTCSTLLVKLIGLFYKIPMLTYLGSVGMGYFNSAYEIYALFCVISTAGLPVAVSVLISSALARGDSEEAESVFQSALRLLGLIGAMGSGAMIVFAKTFCTLLQSEHAYACIVSIAPTVFFTCVSAAFRGYFQGHQKMYPTAVSQVLESVGKLVFGLLLTRFALFNGYETAVVAAFAGGGLTVSTAMSAAYLIFEKIRSSAAEKQRRKVFPRLGQRTKPIWRELAKLSVPMTLGASMVSLTKLVDMTMILRRLQTIGFTESMANEAYGSYTTLALSVFGLLPSFIQCLTLPLVPILSSAIAEKNAEKQEQMVELSYRLTAMVSIPASIGLAVFAEPILLLLFRSDLEAVSFAAPLLSYLGISVFLSCMITSTNAILHAYRVVNRPIVALAAGAAVKIGFAYWLIGSPQFAMAGAPISTFACNGIVVICNVILVSEKCRMPSVRSAFLRPLAAAVPAIGAAYGAFFYGSRRFGTHPLITLGSLCIAVVLCAFFYCRWHILSEEDIGALPFGKPLSRLLLRMHFLKRSSPKDRIFANRKEVFHESTRKH